MTEFGEAERVWIPYPEVANKFVNGSQHDFENVEILEFQAYTDKP